MNLNQWAIKWGIPFDAVEDLRSQMGVVNTDPQAKEGKSEAANQVLVRLEASRMGKRLWRNNVGAFQTDTGSFVRTGLANESRAMNKAIKSADLIGINPILITQAHIGMIIGQFLSREIKPSEWRYGGDEHELAQLKWAELVIALGGDASFAIGEGTL